MLGLIGHEKVGLLTFPDDAKTMFKDYPDIYDMLINKVIFDTEKEEDMQVFFDSLTSVDEENRRGNIGEQEERLLVEGFRQLLGDYDAMKSQKRQILEKRIQEKSEKDNLSNEDLEIIF